MTDEKRFSLRLPENLRTVIENRAKKRLRSVNSEMVVLLKMGLVNETEESEALSVADKLISETQRPSG